MFHQLCSRIVRIYNDLCHVNHGMVCLSRQAGCNVSLGGYYEFGEDFAEGSGPIWLDEMDCTGDEMQITDCAAGEPK